MVLELDKEIEKNFDLDSCLGQLEFPKDFVPVLYSYTSAALNQGECIAQWVKPLVVLWVT